MYKRSAFNNLVQRLQEKRLFIQILSGPRQVGKTTLILQVLETIGIPYQYASADEPTLRDRLWVAQQWDLARLKIKEAQNKEGLLVLDEIQKITGWSEVVKRLWDKDTRTGFPLKVVLTGSAPLLIQKGLTESLAGRFEIIPVTHWPYTEMKEAFGFSLEQYLYFGGYPGAASLISDEKRWSQYILESIIETTVSKDILLLQRVDKPALLRRLFHLGCDYSGQIVSYQKMLGQLQDAGNTTTLAHYLELLSGCGLICGLQKFSTKRIRQKSSSPKFALFNTALKNASSGVPFEEAKRDREFWGRLVETGVGAHLLNTIKGTAAQLYYWQSGHEEVDFVIQLGKKVAALEVKSSRRRETLSGLNTFAEQFKPQKTFLVGPGGVSLEEFFLKPARYWLEE